MPPPSPTPPNTRSPRLQILAFGQTGSGKTHTLLGEVSDATARGVVPRAVAELARRIAASPDPRAFRVALSVVEIYCERIKGACRGAAPPARTAQVAGCQLTAAGSLAGVKPPAGNPSTSALLFFPSPP